MRLFLAVLLFPVAMLLMALAWVGERAEDAYWALYRFVRTFPE